MLAYYRTHHGVKSADFHSQHNGSQSDAVRCVTHLA